MEIVRGRGWRWRRRGTLKRLASIKRNLNVGDRREREGGDRAVSYCSNTHVEILIYLDTRMSPEVGVPLRLLKGKTLLSTVQ